MSKTTLSSLSLMLIAVVVLRPLPTFPVLVRRPILHAVVVRCRCPLPSSATIAVVVRRCCFPLPPSLPQPSLPLHCLCHLLPPALVLPRHSPPPDLASLVIRCRRRPPALSSGVAVTAEMTANRFVELRRASRMKAPVNFDFVCSTKLARPSLSRHFLVTPRCGLQITKRL